MNVSTSLADLFADFERELEKKSITQLETSFETKEDLLTLMCCRYRMKDMFLPEERIEEHISIEDRVLADQIRKHYYHKLTLQMLRGDPVSPYRQALLAFLTKNHSAPNGGYSYPYEYSGIAYKLPEFYEYDRKLEFLAGGVYRAVKGEEVFEGVKQLRFIDCLTLRTKRNKTLEFWFEDEHKNLVMLPVLENNSLAPIFRERVQEKPIAIRGFFKLKGKDTISFYKAYTNWTPA